MQIRFCRVGLFTFVGGRENYNFTILVFRVVFRDYLTSIWLHIIWYLAANLHKKYRIDVIKILICFLSLSLSHSSLFCRCANQFRHFAALHKLFDVQFSKCFLPYAWLLLPDFFR